MKSQQRTARILNQVNSVVDSAPSKEASTKLAQTMTFEQTTGQILSKLFPNGCLNITLNRPEALNALSMEMLVMLNALLKKAITDSSVRFVLIDSASPKAFSAGGDIKRIIRETVEWNSIWHHHLFNLARRVHRYGKPIVVLQNGITMGAGVGMSIYAPFRVIGPNFLWAMPEVGIGLFPDIGGSYFLNHIVGPNKAVGHYLGLTGLSIRAEDAVFAGIATHYSNSLAALKTELTSSNNIADIKQVLQSHSAVPPPNQKPGTALRTLLPRIERCFTFAENESSAGARNVEDVIRSLETDASDWAKSTLAVMGKKSPTSLKVTFEQLRRGLPSSFTAEESLIMEYKLMKNMLLSHDFEVGVRAVVVEKHHNPQWKPPSLAGVAHETVLAFFRDDRLLQWD